ncbi:hypothetical protein F5Y11DRAFT_342601 [Daldinia sp. FL1419]|nr:hypothetical protein F5Y11DRAFT_342601 [Daldinia sp. FL1419]
MNSPRMAISRTWTVLSGRRIATSAPKLLPCESLLRQFSNYQPWYTPSEKFRETSTYQPYPLNSNPGRSSAAHNEPIQETSIASPIPNVHETRPPLQPKPLTHTDVAIAEQEAQKSKLVSSKRKLKPRKAALKLTPSAVQHLRGLLDQPEPKLIKVGVRNRGCSGLSYHLDYVDKAGAFDEEVEQDGVKVLIDSKALFSIIGSEMDWVEDKLSQRFIFRNPNIKEECGCGESFMV